MATAIRTTGFAGRTTTDLLRRASDLLGLWRERILTRRQLSGLDQHLLADIGLSQADVWQEVHKPFWRA